MLERTAASLEACNLQRVLPKASRPPKRTRRLHTGFWQHGASAIELSSLWPLPAPAADAEAPDCAARPAQTGLVASAFLLDFLYPNGTYALLRRLYPALPGPQDGKKTEGSARRRNFTSSTVVAESDAQAPVVRIEAPQTRLSRRNARTFTNNEALHQEAATKTSHTTPTMNADTTERTPAVLDTTDSTLQDTDKTSVPRLKRKSNSRTLQDVLSRPDEERYHDVWDLYCRLDDDQRQALRRQVIIYLAGSTSIVEIGRALSLFRQLPIDSWDDELQAAGVLALLRSGDTDFAIDRFTTGLEQKGLTGGVEHLISNSVENRSWQTLLKVWLDYFAAVPTATRKELHRLETIPNLWRPYFSFERYIETESTGPVRAINLHSSTRLGLSTLRRHLAEAALRQPCPPKQAAVILDIWGDRQMYEDYLLHMVDRWNKGQESRSSLVALPDIYKTYRALPDAKPPVPLLRGLFELYFPTNAAGLEEVYRDWHTAWGDLDQWGFEKFLKFYAGAGDVQAVKDLWARYVARYPDILDLPRAFRSTMNVYAQTGDVAQAEKEFRQMVDKYEVTPDIDTWNTLLKCYVRADDFPRVLQCFEEIDAVLHPNSFTYAHVMAMASKKGDLETTLKFFNRAQKDKVPVSKEMAMALVTAYCRNDRLTDAERICFELAERKATSTGVWNQLLYYNGAQGKLDKCYELLQAMRTYDVEWDSQTHEFLLQALVRVDQIQPAFQLLQKAHEDKLFPVGPEHYAVVMAGAVRTGELALVETIMAQMREADQPLSFKGQVALVEAAIRQNPSAKRTRRLGREFVKHLRAMLPAARTGSSAVAADAPSPNAPCGLVELRRQTQGIGRAIMLLVELRDFATAEELVNVYADMFPKCKGEAAFPPEIASALMLGYLKDGRLAQVHKMWKQTWNSALVRSQRPQGDGIYPAHEYDLARPLNMVAKAFREANDGRGLLQCVEQVTGAGFKLTRSNWNLVVRYLAETGHWERAMHWCEEMLMPRWRGWSATAGSLEERRDLKNTRVLQASKAAVFSLQKEWLKLRKLAAWSGHVSHKLKQIELRHPMLHYAFITTDYEHLPATWVLPRGKSLTRAIKEMLRPVSYEELKIMQRTLERQLRALESHGRRGRRVGTNRSRVKGASASTTTAVASAASSSSPTGGTSSPFHVVTGRNRKEVQTRSARHADLKHLDVALRERLSELQDA
ncbi:coxI translation protein CYA5 [Purpureocillium lavendulum]|uniref:CoxI translation protein CYA5 n=1 Tax=Purpureocillium lavendulum TaxID=1247861 RepID=A0AB34G9H1_9HYPO|nr:coxI translation protein CYA5 [Purpureocillium lavendulum]